MRDKVKLAAALEAIVFAALYGLITYFVIYIKLANGYGLAAYIYNLIFIIAILILDKIIDTRIRKEGFFDPNDTKFHRYIHNFIFALHLVSFKTGLYLFYIIMLILSRISILAPYVVDRYDISFIYSVEYGILLLIPLDKFIELLTKDDKRTLAILQQNLQQNKKSK